MVTRRTRRKTTGNAVNEMADTLLFPVKASVDLIQGVATSFTPNRRKKRR